MKRSFDDYERVARGLFGCSSVWLGSDHLLYIKGKGLIFPIVEEYRRFAYRDIEALTIARTSWFFWGTVLYGFSALLMAGICGLMLMTRTPGETGILLFTLLLPFPITLGFLFLLIRQFVYGRRCICVLQTEQRRIRLRPLSAMTRATEAIRAISPRIAEAQQGIVESPEESSTLPITGVVVPMKVGVLIPIVCFATAIGGGLLLALSLAPSIMLAVAMLALLSIAATALFVMLVSVVRRPTPDSVRNLLWTILGVIIAIGGTSLIYLVTISIDNPGYTTDGGVFRAFADLGSVGAAAFQLIFGVLGAGLTVISGIGALIAMKWRNVLGRQAES